MNNQINFKPISTISVSIQSAVELERIETGKRIRCKFNFDSVDGSNDQGFKSFSKHQQGEFDRCTALGEAEIERVSPSGFKKYMLGRTVADFILIESAKQLSVMTPPDFTHLLGCFYTMLDESNVRIQVECDSFVMTQTILQKFHDFANELSDLSIGFNQLGETFVQFALPFYEQNNDDSIIDLYRSLDDHKRKLYAVPLINLPTFESDPVFDITQNYRVHIELSKNEHLAVKAEFGITIIS